MPALRKSLPSHHHDQGKRHPNYWCLLVQVLLELVQLAALLTPLGDDGDGALLDLALDVALLVRLGEAHELTELLTGGGEEQGDVGLLAEGHHQGGELLAVAVLGQHAQVGGVPVQGLDTPAGDEADQRQEKRY